MDEALSAFGRAVALNPGYAPSHFTLGVTLGEMGRSQEALEALQRAAALNADHAPTHAHLALALQELGRQVEARAAAEQALALDPSLTHAWRTLSDLKTFAPGDPHIERMLQLRASADQRRMGPGGRLDLEFALAKALMDVGDVDRAFAVLDAANRRKRSSFRYHVSVDIADFARIAQAFTPERMTTLGRAGDATDRPVFVVGLPRSGSTLVEQILASHPLVHGGGELLLLDKVMRGLTVKNVAALTTHEINAAGESYGRCIADLGPAKARVVDKTLANFRHAGLISLMLPNARIVHCRRDLKDVGLSCFAQNFADHVPFAYDLREFGLYARAYQRLMAHWRALLPQDRFIEIDYEELVQDLEGQAKRLIGFCGLDWDPQCLAFHRTVRPVRTASVNQVRRPLYTSSAGRWKAYAGHLGPLLEVLGG